MRIIRTILGLAIGVKPIPYLKKKKIYDVANSKDWKIIDVRPKNEYQDVRIATSISIPLLSTKKKIGQFVDKKEDKVLIVCWNGHRAALLTRELYADGYNVKLLKGGINGLHKTKWSEIIYVAE